MERSKETITFHSFVTTLFSEYTALIHTTEKKIVQMIWMKGRSFHTGKSDELNNARAIISKWQWRD